MPQWWRNKVNFSLRKKIEFDPSTKPIAAEGAAAEHKQLRLSFRINLADDVHIRGHG
jgi:hypothetical protein